MQGTCKPLTTTTCPVIHRDSLLCQRKVIDCWWHAQTSVCNQMFAFASQYVHSQNLLQPKSLVCRKAFQMCAKGWIIRSDMVTIFQGQFRFSGIVCAHTPLPSQACKVLSEACTCAASQRANDLQIIQFDMVTVFHGQFRLKGVLCPHTSIAQSGLQSSE